VPTLGLLVLLLKDLCLAILSNPRSRVKGADPKKGVSVKLLSGTAARVEVLKEESN